MLISGQAENLSRIAPIFDTQGNELMPSKKANRILYESQESKESLQIHRMSSLF